MASSVIVKDIVTRTISVAVTRNNYVSPFSYFADTAYEQINGYQPIGAIPNMSGASTVAFCRLSLADQKVYVYANGTGTIPIIVTYQRT